MDIGRLAHVPTRSIGRTARGLDDTIGLAVGSGEPSISTAVDRQPETIPSSCEASP
jgi:hypothetical protein